MHKHYLIAKEGWTLIGISLTISMALQCYAGKWVLPAWLITFFVISFFRDPERIVSVQPSAILSPADGRIVAVEKTKDPYQKSDALKIAIFMNVFNIHANYLPVAGTIRQVQYHPGKFFKASLDKASKENERNALLIDMQNGQSITVVQIAGLIAKRILCYISAGDKVNQGQRYGFIRFGSRVEVYLPITAKPHVAIGDHVTNAQTIIAQL
ncbi:MAG: phosphatidylserine decarboxylase [Neisseriales bacterium]|nr:MAG: phosphatidylserine decarboxylase [Neisseriales bacterium]